MLARFAPRFALGASLAALALWAVPSEALGSTLAPNNDNFLAPFLLNSQNSRLNATSTLQNISETIGASLQTNIFDPCGSSKCRNGPAEVSTCHGVHYGNTVWYDFYPDHDGQVEIRTAGIPNVIALYTFNSRTLEPDQIQCAKGSSTPSNVLFEKVRHGVGYSFQIGARDSIGGSLKMLFNYAYSKDLAVAPFLTAAKLPPIAARPGKRKLVRLEFIGLTRHETVSYACAFCRSGSFGVPTKQGNIEVLHARSAPIVSSRTRFIIGASAPAQIGRFRLYGVDVSHLRLRLIAQGCLPAGVTSVSAAAAARLSLLTRFACPTPPVVVIPAGGEYVFWKSTEGRLWEKWYAGGRWSRPMALAPRKLGSPPTVAVHTNGEQDVFWRGAHGNLWDYWYTGKWNGPVVFGGWRLGSPPTAGVDAADNEYVFWKGMNGRLWEKTFSSGSWRRPVALNSGLLGSAPSVAVHANGEQDVFWRGRDGNLWETWYTGKWNGPVNRGDGPLGSAPSAGVDSAGDEYVFWKGTDGVLREKLYAARQWGPALALNVSRLASAPSVAVHANGEQDVFWRDRHGFLRDYWYTGQWYGPVVFGPGHLAQAPSVGVAAAGKQSSG